MQVTSRIATADWVLLSSSLGFNDAQKYLFMVLPNIADTNGCFEHMPQMICSITHCKMVDLEQLIRIMNEQKLIEPYEVCSRQYWYLTRFLEMQKLRTKAKTPSPPWLTWKPESYQNPSRGSYVDKRMLQPALDAIDKKLPLDCDCDCEEIEKNNVHCTDIANALSTDNKYNTEQENIAIDKKLPVNSSQNLSRMETALHELLDGKYNIRSTLTTDMNIQKEQILKMLQICSRSLEIWDIVDQYSITWSNGKWIIE